MTEYNGHKSWNQWNVSLWINNDEGLHRLALDCIEAMKGRGKGARMMLSTLHKEGTNRTPDGGSYNYTAIYNAMEGM